MLFIEFAKGLLINLFVLLALVTLCGLIRGWFMKHRRSVPVWQTGLLFGVMATVSMFFPVITRSGMIFDCRSAVIGTAALMGGPLAALSSLPIPFAYRFFLGGDGVLPGLMEIIFPSILGSFCYLWFRRHGRLLTVSRVFLSSLLIAVGTNLTIISLIKVYMPDKDIAMGGGLLALIILNPVVTMTILGSLILAEREHFDAVEALAESERRMRHSQKMAAIGQLSRKLTHSFVNSLTTMLGNAQLVKDHIDRSSEATKHVENIINSVGRLSYLTGELLAFANPAPLRMRKMDVSKSLSGINEILTRSIGPEVVVKIHAEEKVGKGNIDPDQIAQAIVHMAVNADEAMSSHGYLSIKASAVDLSAKRLRELRGGVVKKESHRGAFALISIKDTGSGMSQETCSRIFEPFFTTKEKNANAGLGLATVYNIVELHNGYIDVQTREGHGTTFLIHLPVLEPAE